jgi:hypothetical protein
MMAPVYRIGNWELGLAGVYFTVFRPGCTPVVKLPRPEFLYAG